MKPLFRPRQLPSLARTARAGLRTWAAGLGLGLALAGCGGGTEQATAFVPKRLFALGDETVMLVDDGSHDGWRHGINDRATANAAGKCANSPSFVQMLANTHAMVFAACNPSGAAVNAFTLGQPEAKVGDALTGLAAQRAAISELGAGDLFTVYIGVHDVLEIFRAVRDGTMSQAQGEAEAAARAKLTVTEIVGMLDTGARGIVYAIPRLSHTPYAEKAEAAAAGAKALLSTLSTVYNNTLLLEPRLRAYDGTRWGVVMSDSEIDIMHTSPTLYLSSPYVVNQAACDPAKAATVLACTQDTLVANATLSNHLWADDLRLGPMAHNRLGLSGQSRLLNNRF